MCLGHKYFSHTPTISIQSFLALYVSVDLLLSVLIPNFPPHIWWPTLLNKLIIIIYWCACSQTSSEREDARQLWWSHLWMSIAFSEFDSIKEVKVNSLTNKISSSDDPYLFFFNSWLPWTVRRVPPCPHPLEDKEFEAQRVPWPKPSPFLPLVAKGRSRRRCEAKLTWGEASKGMKLISDKAEATCEWQKYLQENSHVRHKRRKSQCDEKLYTWDVLGEPTMMWRFLTVVDVLWGMNGVNLTQLFHPHSWCTRCLLF